MHNFFNKRTNIIAELSSLCYNVVYIDDNASLWPKIKINAY